MGRSAVEEVRKVLLDRRGDFVRFDRPHSKVTGCIHGLVPSKYNSSRVILCPHERRVSRHIMLPDDEVDDFRKRLDLAAGELKTKPMLDGVLRLDAVVYVTNVLRDLTVEILLDSLQRSGLVRNDRKFWDKHYRRCLVKQMPRVEFTVQPVSTSFRPREEEASAALFETGEEE